MPYMALESICCGEGRKDHIDTILRELHLLQFAADHRQHMTAKQICELAQVALGNMIDRVKRSGRVGISGEEKKLFMEGVYSSGTRPEIKRLFDAAGGQKPPKINAIYA